MQLYCSCEEETMGSASDTARLTKELNAVFIVRRSWRKKGKGKKTRQETQGASSVYMSCHARRRQTHSQIRPAFGLCSCK